jgi:hypothetical protein
MHIVVLCITTPCGLINWVLRNGGMNQTIHLLSLPRIRMSGSIPPLRRMPSWRTQRKLYHVTYIYSLFNDAFVKSDSTVLSYRYRSE